MLDGRGADLQSDQVRHSAVPVVCLSLLTISCSREGWYRCHYRAVPMASDGKKGAPCVSQALVGAGPGKGALLAEVEGEAGSPIHGWVRVVRPEEAGTIQVHLITSCRGYADESRDFTWEITPDTCKPGVEVGEVILAPGTPGAWPGRGASSVQETK